jgi:S-adenosylmethionine uptake transporter
LTSPSTTGAPSPASPHALQAILLTVAGYACFNIGDATLKAIAGTFSTAQIISINGLSVAAMMCVYGFLKEGRRAFRLQSWRWVLLRALFAVGTGLCNVVALPHIRLTTFYTLVFTSPFWVAILSAVFLGEKLPARRMAVIGLGFLVIAWILRPGSDIFHVWSFVVLGSALLYSCSIVIMRYLGTRESRTVIIASGSLLGALLALPFAAAQALPDITLVHAGLFALLAGSGAVGVVCIAYAFQTAPSAAVIAPFHYTQMIWGALIGYFIFAEVPDLPTMAGAAVLIAGGLALIYLESRALRASAQQTALPFQSGGWFSRLRAYSPSPKER